MISSGSLNGSNFSGGDGEINHNGWWIRCNPRLILVFPKVRTSCALPTPTYVLVRFYVFCSFWSVHSFVSSFVRFVFASYLFRKQQTAWLKISFAFWGMQVQYVQLVVACYSLLWVAVELVVAWCSLLQRERERAQRYAHNAVHDNVLCVTLFRPCRLCTHRFNEFRSFVAMCRYCYPFVCCRQEARGVFVKSLGLSTKSFSAAVDRWLGPAAKRSFSFFPL